jgi:MFS family permease
VFRELAGTHGFLLTLAVIFTLQTVDRSFSPILPLFVEQLGVETARVATVSGLLFSVIAVSAALGHRTAPRFMARWDAKPIMTSAAAGTAVALLTIVLVPSLATLAGAAVVASFAIGVAMTAAYSVGGALLPPDAHVTGFGIMTSASLVGLAFSPVLAGIVGASGLRVVFVVDVLLLIALCIAVASRMRASSVAVSAAAEGPDIRSLDRPPE